jgi:hypothetical protein
MPRVAVIDSPRLGMLCIVPRRVDACGRIGRCLAACRRRATEAQRPGQARRLQPVIGSLRPRPLGTQLVAESRPRRSLDARLQARCRNIKIDTKSILTPRFSCPSSRDVVFPSARTNGNQNALSVKPLDTFLTQKFSTVFPQRTAPALARITAEGPVDRRSSLAFSG